MALRASELCSESSPGLVPAPTPYYARLLDSDRFRVVVVAPGGWHDPIRCDIVHRELVTPSKGGPYKALSYVWGSPKVKDTIYLDGVATQVTLNLFCALKYLRHANVDGRDLILWVDALQPASYTLYSAKNDKCINQQDADERSDQVQLMRQIYQNAAEVVVFIGDGRSHRIQHSNLVQTPDTSVIRLTGDGRDENFCRTTLDACHSASLRKVRSPAIAARLAIGLLRLLSDSANLHQVYEDIMTLHPGIRNRVFECLRAFLIAPWWSRIWVVQEIAVSAAATVQFGTITVPWRVLVSAAEVISSSTSTFIAMEPENYKVLDLFVSQTSSIERTRTSWHADGGDDLARLLQEFSNRQASDDRDKVFGILSLANAGHGITPNYNVDVLETYRRTALSILQHDTRLSCWIGDQKRKNHKELPSWIPDWSTAFDPADLHRSTWRKDLVPDSTWQLRIVNSEHEYWQTVGEEAKKLVEYQTSMSGPGARLPMSLASSIHSYIVLLRSRLDALQSPDAASSTGPPMMTQYETWCGLQPQSYAGSNMCEEAEKRLIRKTILNLISTCERFTFGYGDEWSHWSGAFNLFKNSYSFQENAGWMTSLQWDVVWLPMAQTVQPLARLDQDTHQFTLQSLYIETVHKVGQRMFGWSNLDAALHTLAQWLRMFRSWHEFLDEGHLTLFARAVIGGMQAGDSRSDTSWLSEFAETILSQSQSSMVVEGVPVYSDLDFSWCKEPPTRFLEDMQRATDGRVFFISTSGAPGLGPASMGPGDEVHVLPSGPSPFVLRPLPSPFTFRLVKNSETDYDVRRLQLIGDCDLASNNQALIREVQGDDHSAPAGSLPFEILSMCYTRLSGELSEPGYGPIGIHTITLT